MWLRCELSDLSGMRRWLASRAQRRIREVPQLCPLSNLYRESEDSDNPTGHSNSEVEAPRPVLIRGAQLCPSSCSTDLPRLPSSNFNDPANILHCPNDLPPQQKRYDQPAESERADSCDCLPVHAGERRALVPYRGSFDGIHALPVSVAKTCLVRFDNNKYSVMSTAVGRPVDIHAYADRIVIRQEGAVVGEHVRCLGRGETIHNPWHYVPVLTRKPGALRNGAPFRDWPLPSAMERIRRRLKGMHDGDRQIWWTSCRPFSPTGSARSMRLARKHWITVSARPPSSSTFSPVAMIRRRP